MAEKLKVTGIKFFKDSIDGEAIDSGSVFIEERLNDRNNEKGRMGGKGYATTKYALENAKQAESLMEGEFPFVAEVEFERMTDGKGGSKNVITLIRRTTEAPVSRKVA